MARHLFGGTPTDWTMNLGTPSTTSGFTTAPALAAGPRDLTMWSAATSGVQYTDLLDASGAAVTTITSADGSGTLPVGSIPEFSGPDGVTQMWADAGGGVRYKLVATDSGDIAAQAGLDAAGAVADLAVHEAEPNPHGTKLGDLANVTAPPSDVLGRVLAQTGEDTWGAVTIEGAAPVQSVDGLTGAVQLQGLYPRRSLLAQAAGDLTSPLMKVVFDHVPDSAETDLMQVSQTNAGTEAMTSWMNERGNWRLEQAAGSYWDHLLLTIVAAAADPATSGWPLRIERRESGGTRTPIGGIDPTAHYVTSLHTWEPITVIDPDGTGRYSASGTVGPAELGVRLETDDVVRMQGRIACTSIVAGDAILSFPTGYLPKSSRLVTLANDDGAIVVAELTAAGQLVARTAVASATELSVDDVTFAVVEAPQDTGEWTIDSVASATPSSVSPLPLNYSGVAGRMYVVIIATNSALTTAPVGVTDTGGNTWNIVDWAPQSGSTGRRVEMWYTVATAGFTSVSAGHAADVSRATLLEITGHAASPLDVGDADIRSSSTSPAPLNITPTVADTLVIAAVHANGNTVDQITPSSGWVTLASDAGGPKIVYRTDAAAATPVGVSWTFASSTGSGHVIAALKKA